MAKIYDLMQERAALTAQIRELMNRVEDAELGAEDKTHCPRGEAAGTRAAGGRSAGCPGAQKAGTGG